MTTTLELFQRTLASLNKGLGAPAVTEEHMAEMQQGGILLEKEIELLYTEGPGSFVEALQDPASPYPLLHYLLGVLAERLDALLAQEQAVIESAVQWYRQTTGGGFGNGDLFDRGLQSLACRTTESHPWGIARAVLLVMLGIQHGATFLEDNGYSTEARRAVRTRLEPWLRAELELAGWLALPDPLAGVEDPLRTVLEGTLLIFETQTAEAWKLARVGQALSDRIQQPFPTTPGSSSR